MSDDTAATAALEAARNGDPAAVANAVAAIPVDTAPPADQALTTLTADLAALSDGAGPDEALATIRTWRQDNPDWKPPATTEPLPFATWPATDPPARNWLIRDLLPAGRLAALYGTGGTGKSTLALQIAAAVMHGGPPINPKPKTHEPDQLAADFPILQPLPEAGTGKVLWLTWEDERDEVIRRWRMAYHARAIAPGFPDPDRLHLVDMRRIGGPLWGPECGAHVSTAATWTEAGERFRRTLEGHRLAVIDPLAAAFASSEIDRSLVRAFTSAIDAAAEAAGCTVLLIAHPSKAGAADGSSGSTDWQASIRTHLVLEKGDTGLKPDGGAQETARAWRLVNPKQSYAEAGGHLWLVRHWQAADPERNTAPELAWFGARREDAAAAYERANAGRSAGRQRIPAPRTSRRNGVKETPMTREELDAVLADARKML